MKKDYPVLMSEALAAWREHLGPDHVITVDQRLDLANQATFATTARSSVLLEPGNRDEVAACLHVAHRFCIPLYPVSTGLNWGYGSRVPAQDGCVLLSLGSSRRSTSPGRTTQLGWTAQAHLT